MKGLKINIISLLLVTCTFLVSITACNEDKDVAVSAKLYSEATTILQGDTAEIIVELTGTPPFGFRFSNGIESIFELGIVESPHIIKVTPDTTTTYSAESVGTYYRNVGPATGTATITVTPVRYDYDQTISGKKSAFLHATNGYQTGTELQIRTQNAAFDRRGFIEFDASEISTVEEYSKYIFRFWLTQSHAQGVSAGVGAMEVKGTLGGIDETWTWNSQPTLEDLTTLFSQTFNPVTTSTQIMFEGDITKIVRAALASLDKKFTLRIIENLNNNGNGGYYFIGSTTYSDESKRPVIEVLLRKPIN